MNRSTLIRKLYIALFSIAATVLVVALLWLLGDISLPVVHAEDFTVDITTDENDGECIADCSLRDAIILANGNGQADIITLGAATYTLSIAGQNEDAAATGDLDITAPLTINGAGPGHTFIDANGIDRVFDVRPGAGTVIISGATILNGNIGYPKRGGGISNADADLILINTVIQGNSAFQGGGIYVGTGCVAMSGGQISDNAAEDGGGIFVATGSATLDGGRILGNTVIKHGGALHTAFWSNGTIAMAGGCIVNNSDISVANAGGGALTAINVWWGSASGPSGQGPGVGDSVGTDVVYIPFSTVANGCPPRANFWFYLPTVSRNYVPSQ